MVMKVDKKSLRKNIENILAEGIINGEEIDITADKIIDQISGLIAAVENIDTKNNTPF